MINSLALGHAPVHDETAKPLRTFLAQFDAQATHHSLRGPRYEISYSVLGEGQPVYLASGICTPRRLFAPLAVELAEHFQVVLFDLPGVNAGDGSNLRRYALGDYPNDLFVLADYLGHRSFSVIANSFGTTITIRAMAQAPSRIVRAMLTGGFAQRGLTRLERLLFHMLRRWPGTIARAPFMERLNRYNHQRELDLREPRLTDFFLVEGGKVPVRTVAAQVLAVSQTNIVETAKEIRQPVMLVHGAEDRLVPPRYSGELARLIPNVRIMLIPRCGHLPHLSHPELLTRAFVRFAQETS